MTLEQHREALTAVVHEAMKRLQVPGVAVAIADDPDELTLGLGVTSVENPLPVTPDTIFQVGSTSKTFTASAVMHFVERGDIDLDAPVRKYLPDFRLSDDSQSGLLTVRHCLTHYGGWVGDYFRDTGRGPEALVEMVARVAKAPQLTPVGSCYSYNNTGFTVAGRVLEVVSGRLFEELIEELFVRPLGMENTAYRPEDIMTKRFAVGHFVTRNGARAVERWGLARSSWPVGGVLSSVVDQLTWARMNMAAGRAPNGEQLLAPESIATMQAAQAPAGSICEEIGLAWMRMKAGGQQLVYHGGSTAGQQCAFVMIPDRQFAAVVHTNSSAGRDLHREVVDWTLHEVAGIPDEPPAALALSADELRQYEGRYAARLTEVEVTASDGGLSILGNDETAGASALELVPPEPVQVAFVAPDHVTQVTPRSRWSRGEFLRGPDGSIEWFRWGGRLHRPLS